MLKIISVPILFSFMALFGFLQTEVSVNLNMPDVANAGEEFLVELTINKGDVEGFARFEQDLPVGFKAVARQTANGDFKFEDQKIKIQWMRVPYDKSVVVSYAVQVDPTIAGDFTFAGKFSYIRDNGVQVAMVNPASINIIGDETAAGTMESAMTTYSYQNVSLKTVDCIRQKPYLNDNNEVIVNLMINKGDLTDFGKIQEEIPRGYKAVSLKSKNSIFTSKNNIIKFLWMNMPPEPQFTVSYKLVPIGEIPDQQFIITGTFSYAENERTIPISIAERNIDLGEFDGDQLVAANVGEPAAEEEVIVAEPVYVAPEEYTPVAEVVPEPEPEVERQPSFKPRDKKKQPQSTQGNLAALVGMPLPDAGVSYRVQVAAGHNLVEKNYFKRLNVTDHVQVELHDGWHKYTVGNFVMYRDARDYRIYVWNNTPIHDAFVSAYNSGMRITVQEALMIANQKWYK